MNLLNRCVEFNRASSRQMYHFTRNVWLPQTPGFKVMKMTEEDQGIQPSVRLQTYADILLQMPATTPFLARFNLHPRNDFQRKLVFQAALASIHLLSIIKGAAACIKAAHLYRTEGKEGMRDFLKAHRYEVCEFLSTCHMALVVGASLGLSVGSFYLCSRLSKSLI